MPQAIWTQAYEVNTLVLNHHRRLGLVGMLKLLQDAAWKHAEHLGHGYEAMLAQRTLWVLTRFALTMERWPAWGESIVIRTWVRPPVGALAQRDSEILIGDRKIGEATACWLTLHADTRRPLRLSLGEGALAVREEGVLTLTPAKLALRPALVEQSLVPVRLGDLDLNGHVSNVCYAQWMLDALPEVEAVSAYEITFLGESRLGDTVRLEYDRDRPDQPWIQGLRSADGKPVFAARLTVSGAAAPHPA